jgi:putative transposase
MTKGSTATRIPLSANIQSAWQDVDSSFERFCLTAGLGAIEQMLRDDARHLTGAPYGRGEHRVGHRWGTTKGKIGFHGGKVAVHRPRVRSYDGQEVELPTWTAAQAEDWLGRWAMNLMLINVSTRKLQRAVRLPDGNLPVVAGDGTSKSAASRRFVALSAQRLAAWMTCDLSKLELLVIQIDGLHIGNDLVLVAALGIDAEGRKHPLALVEGATENAAVVQALIDNLIARGLEPKVCRLFIVDGAKALSKVIRRTFGAHTPIQRCQIHKARNVTERLPKALHASIRRALRQAWELDDADKRAQARRSYRSNFRNSGSARRMASAVRSGSSVGIVSAGSAGTGSGWVSHPIRNDGLLHGRGFRGLPNRERQQNLRQHRQHRLQPLLLILGS